MDIPTKTLLPGHMPAQFLQYFLNGVNGSTKNLMTSTLNLIETDIDSNLGSYPIRMETDFQGNVGN